LEGITAKAVVSFFFALPSFCFVLLSVFIFSQQHAASGVAT
jgi:hypothetical protein